MSTPESTPQQPTQSDEFAEFGGTASQTASQTASPTTPQTSDPFAEFGGNAAGSTTNTSNSAPDVIASDATKIPNARIRNMTVDPTKDTHSAGGAFLSGAKTGTELAAIPAAIPAAGSVLSALPEVGEAVMSHLEEQAAEWATKYPALTKMMMHAAPGLVPTAAGIIGYLIHKAK